MPLEEPSKQGHKTHSSLPSLTFSITSTEHNPSHPSSPLGTSFDTSLLSKRPNEPTKRWDDSQLEMELADDDDFIQPRRPSLRLKQKLLPSENYWKGRLTNYLNKLSHWFS
ncbi:hypothetical protein BY458DRAFT_497033 [Sporodiniella umbellata]|nr:hypothetical protein BY458DRAFT_497033 [Sporodiniella umbellata]